MSNNISSLNWFITGCSSGLGRCIAEAALAHGQKVAVTARDLYTLRDLEGADCKAFALDVTDPASIASAVSDAASTMGRLDVVVNNAGYGLTGAIEECSDAQIRRNMETNFFGPLNVIRAVAPLLRGQRSGHIVNISAAAALANYPGFGIYGGAKAALDLMSESLAAELRPLGVKVTLVHPGPFRTAFTSRGLESAEQSIADYDGTSGKFSKFLKAMNGKQPGDPAKAASLIVRTVLSGDAPMRLPLGKYMIRKTRDKAAFLNREADKWEAEAGSTEFA